MKTLNKDQALYCAKIFNDYFGQFNRIDEYMRDQKMSQLNDTISASLPGMGPETEIFDNFDMINIEKVIQYCAENKFQTFFSTTDNFTLQGNIDNLDIKEIF